MLTIEENIAECQKGNVDAFSDIYEHFVKRIYDFIYYKTFDQETAEDITSDVFFKALKNISSFSGNTEKDLSSWIYRIAYNSVVDFYRTKKEEVDLSVIENTHGYEDDRDGEIDNKNKLAEVLGYLETLDKDYKDILIMRVWDELSYAEISKITGKSVDNCKKIVSRVLKQIQANFAFLLLVLFIV